MLTSQELRAKAARLMGQADETDDSHYRVLLRGLAVDVLAVANEQDGALSLHHRQRWPVQPRRSDVDRPARVG
jgi:hypothetical protein